MIDVYDSETIIKVYRLLNKKCEAIDSFIKEHALCFGACVLEYGTEDVCNNMIELIARKNKLINLKIIVDNAINNLPANDKKILFIKMNYAISMEELCGVLELKERTAFRRIERAFTNLCDELNKSKHIRKLENILNSEDWIYAIKQEIKSRRIAFKCRAISA